MSASWECQGSCLLADFVFPVRLRQMPPVQSKTRKAVSSEDLRPIRARVATASLRRIVGAL